METFKVKTGLKAGADCIDLVQEYQEKCGDPGDSGRDRQDPGWREWGQDVGSSWRDFGMSFIP